MFRKNCVRVFGQEHRIQPVFSRPGNAAAKFKATEAGAWAHKQPPGSRIVGAGPSVGFRDYSGFIPPLERFWVRAPASPLNTAATRREWFRVMTLNAMTDTVTAHKRLPRLGADGNPVAGGETFATKPVVEVDIKSSASGTQPQEEEEEKNESASVPPEYMNWPLREKRLMEEIVYYDADIVLLNEVNKVNFNSTFWRAFRSQGYGGLYVSARKDGWKKTLRHGESPLDKRLSHKVEPEEDIGNVVLFHKGRFFPYLMPRAETPYWLHYAGIYGFRDRVTNCLLLCCCVQFSPGAGPQAVATREREARQLLVVLDPTLNRTSERSHTGLMICGDFNNESPEEPCVSIIRDRYYSSYDVVGGPQWTAWFHKKSAKSKEEVGGSAHSTSSSIMSNNMAESGRNGVDPKHPDGSQQQSRGETNSNEVARHPRPHVDDEVMLPQNVVKRTSDFMFFDAQKLSLLQVLEPPADAHIDRRTLLPNPLHPFHHINLVGDYCWNDWNPDVAAYEPHPNPSG